LILKSGEQVLNRVEHDALGADLIDGILKANEESFEVVGAGFLNLGGLDLDVIHHDLFASGEGFEIETERCDVFRHLVAGFLEGHEDAGFVEFRGATDEEFHREHSLAAAWTATDDGGASLGESAVGDLIKASDARQ